jgi:hypothetical protein
VARSSWWHPAAKRFLGTELRQQTFTLREPIQ